MTDSPRRRGGTEQAGLIQIAQDCLIRQRRLHGLPLNGIPVDGLRRLADIAIPLIARWRIEAERDGYGEKFEQALLAGAGA